MAAAREAPAGKVVADNRRARFDYEILDTVEAGIVLSGSEVKSLRQGRASLAESHAGEMGGDLWLFNMHIPEYGPSSRFGHEPKRPRKLLLHRKEINRLIGAVQKEGMTVVPLRIYFNARGIAKLLIALARGKKAHDKRETEKKRDWQREKSRLMREKG
jgi:SsrA-binding protein